MKTKMSQAWVVCAAVTTVNVLTSAGFSAVALLSPGIGDVYTMYAAGRSFSLVLVVLFVLFRRSENGLAFMALTLGLVQAFDAVVGVISHDLTKTIGPAVLALATWGTFWAMRMKRQPS